MRRRIIIHEETITKQGQWKLFQIRLPKNTKRIVGVASDVRIETAVAFGGAEADVVWPVDQNPLIGKLILQSMEKANIFFYDQLWAVKFNDGISDLDKVDSQDAYAMIVKPEARKVDVPCESTIINALYKDILATALARDLTYKVKVILWTECDENEVKP